MVIDGIEITESGLEALSRLDYSDDDPRDAPADPDNLLAATDPLHVFGADGYCDCGVHVSKGWVQCRPESEAEARIQWNEIIGLNWRRTGNAAPVPYVAAPPRTRAKPKRVTAEPVRSSPGLWDES